MKWYTVKYNNQNSHRLDTFADEKSAIESAKALHNPDWPTGQGIRVKRGNDHFTCFDSASPEEFNCTVCGQTKDFSAANYNCTGEIICDDCQPDYYRH